MRCDDEPVIPTQTATSLLVAGTGHSHAEDRHGHVPGFCLRSACRLRGPRRWHRTARADRPQTTAAQSPARGGVSVVAVARGRRRAVFSGTQIPSRRSRACRPRGRRREGGLGADAEVPSLAMIWEVRPCALTLAPTATTATRGALVAHSDAREEWRAAGCTTRRRHGRLRDARCRGICSGWCRTSRDALRNAQLASLYLLVWRGPLLPTQECRRIPRRTLDDVDCAPSMTAPCGGL